MNAWTRWRTAILGVALIVATNAVALVGVAYNRGGEPESVLLLSRREIDKTGEWGFGRENSGLELYLRWKATGSGYFGFNFFPEGDAEDVPSWIDSAKLSALGFDVPETMTGDKLRRHIERQLSRDALVVLELDGPAYREDVERVRRRAAEEQARTLASPNDAELRRRAESAKKQLERMEQEESRLYMVDAGPDLASLRTKYPDKARYAIVHARIRPIVHERKGKMRLGAYAQPTTPHIMVPLEYREVWEKNTAGGVKSSTVEVGVAFGKRLEPWIVSLKSLSSKAP